MFAHSSIPCRPPQSHSSCLPTLQMELKQKFHHFRSSVAGLDHYVRHVSSSGSTVFPANTNTYSVVENALDPPALASRIRIVPFSRHQRTVCMRIELKGCPYSGEFPDHQI